MRLNHWTIDHVVNEYGDPATPARLTFTLG
jgi:hypothetical protein